MNVKGENEASIEWIIFIHNIQLQVIEIPN